MASRLRRPARCAALALALTASLSACAQGGASPASPPTQRVPAPTPLAVEAPEPVPAEPKALSPLPKVP